MSKKLKAESKKCNYQKKSMSGKSYKEMSRIQYRIIMQCFLIFIVFCSVPGIGH